MCSQLPTLWITYQEMSLCEQNLNLPNTWLFLHVEGIFLVVALPLSAGNCIEADFRGSEGYCLYINIQFTIITTTGTVISEELTLGKHCKSSPSLTLTRRLALAEFGVVGLLEFGVVDRLLFGVVGLPARDPDRKSGNR
ncbi:hypothetical protein C1H46_009751 [Malus baccata]|uniref:Uncharacterized protein n=1 Tax=Malus baccata TaxID=106549 RepID=A0A540N0S9_MALBA|nr:hypothetical protein C1H46_009751 [Malus baccata]